MNSSLPRNQSGGNVNPWQLLEFKSARSEGVLASLILSIAREENLSLRSRLFYATGSPLEYFLPNAAEFNKPLGSDLEYLEDRARLLSLCRRLQVQYESSREARTDIENIKWLLKFQLYGFCLNCFENRKYLIGLLALKEAELLERWQIKKTLSEIAKKDKKAKSTIAEFIEI